jgi:hypothetical protein
MVHVNLISSTPHHTTYACIHDLETRVIETLMIDASHRMNNNDDSNDNTNGDSSRKERFLDVMAIEHVMPFKTGK